MKAPPPKLKIMHNYCFVCLLYTGNNQRLLSCVIVMSAILHESRSWLILSQIKKRLETDVENRTKTCGNGRKYKENKSQKIIRKQQLKFWGHNGEIGLKEFPRGHAKMIVKQWKVASNKLDYFMQNECRNK